MIRLVDIAHSSPYVFSFSMGATPMRAVLQSCGAVLVMAAAAFGQDKMPWQPNLETAQRMAAETNRLVLIHFWAPWCRPCVRLEQEVFSNAETAKGLEANFVMVKLNADEAPGTARLYGVSSLPTDVITTPAGRMVSQIQSPPSVAQYVTQMNQAAEGHRSLARKPDRPSVQQPAPPLGSGASYGPQYAPGAMPTAGPPPAYQPPTSPQQAPPGNDGYAEYFPQQQSQAPQTNSQYGQVAPTQAHSAVPGAAPTPTSPNPVDPYAAPVASQSPPANPYAAPAASQSPPANPYAAPAASQPPPANPYAGPAASQPLAADPYAAPAPAQSPAVNPYAASPPPAQQPPAAVYSAAPPSAQPPAAAIGQAPYNSQQLATAPALSQPPNAPQLPPGCPPLGLDGNCPVTLVERKRWVAGQPAYGAVHRGRTYLFLGPQEKEKFLADPDRYSPVLSGIDPVLAFDKQVAVPGRREFGVFGADGQVYLFADENSRARFEANEQAYASRARQATQTQYQAMRPGAR
jgi:YHS domain-containing protein/thiol-disulfide isomerase/thioredoxin